LIKAGRHPGLDVLLLKRFWLALIRHGRAKVETGDLVDFRFVVDGRVVLWPEAIFEYNRNDDDISVWIAKQDKYALRMAVEEELRRRKLRGWARKPRLFGNPDERFTWLRDRWLWMPLFLRPVVELRNLGIDDKRLQEFARAMLATRTGSVQQVATMMPAVNTRDSSR
jgi:hypothetical protein